MTNARLKCRAEKTLHVPWRAILAQSHACCSHNMLLFPQAVATVVRIPNGYHAQGPADVFWRNFCVTGVVQRIAKRVTTKTVRREPTYELSFCACGNVLVNALLCAALPKTACKSSFSGKTTVPWKWFRLSKRPLPSQENYFCRQFSTAPSIMQQRLHGRNGWWKFNRLHVWCSHECGQTLSSRGSESCFCMVELTCAWAFLTVEQIYKMCHNFQMLWIRCERVISYS